MRRGSWAALIAVAGWYAFALAVLHPIAQASVVDSWLYGAAVRRFLRSGEIRFAGFSQAMPAAQILYGAAWGRVCGAGSASLTLSIVPIAILCAVMFHALVRRCGAARWQAMAATGLVVCNPCFLFLSFSFMTDLPFLAFLVGALLAFANAKGQRAARWLWIAAAVCVGGFLVRPFAGMAIAGCAGAILIDRCGIPGVQKPRRATDWKRLAIELAPFAAALAVCAAIWIRLTVLGPKPWALQMSEGNFSQFFAVPIASYLRAGILSPAIYLGTVMAPTALLQIATPKRARIAIIAAALFAAAIFLMRLDPSLPVTPEFSCFGGWSNVLILRGLPNRFLWNSEWQYAFLALGCVGAAGLIVAATEIAPRLNRAAIAVTIAALVYWTATIPLWFFNDRYYLPLVPAAALIVARARLPRSRFVKGAAFAMTLAMGLMSLGGTYAYQRGLSAIVQARNSLEAEGVPRAKIDAGYEMNGEDLYRYPKEGIDTMQFEAGIPMITSAKLDEYTIAAAPIPGLKIIRTLEWPGMFGLGRRDLYVLKRPPPVP